MVTHSIVVEYQALEVSHDGHDTSDCFALPDVKSVLLQLELVVLPVTEEVERCGVKARRETLVNEPQMVH